MNTLEYVKHRKKNKCQQPTIKPIDTKLYHKLGLILTSAKEERDQMQVSKPEVLMLPSRDMDFIF